MQQAYTHRDDLGKSWPGPDHETIHWHFEPQPGPPPAQRPLCRRPFVFFETSNNRVLGPQDLDLDVLWMFVISRDWKAGFFCKKLSSFASSVRSRHFTGAVFKSAELALDRRSSSEHYGSKCLCNDDSGFHYIRDKGKILHWCRDFNCALGQVLIL